MPPTACLFCQIASGDVPSEKVWENEDYLAFNDKYPVASTHVVVIPKTHVSKKSKMMDKNQDHWAKLMAAVFEVVKLKKLN